jgi:diguanylate cyclase (GGDEF)-like protein/PAS domain S-box-containing protein
MESETLVVPAFETANAADLALFEVLSDVSLGVLVSGKDGLMRFCNSSFTRITGFSQEDIIGRNCGFMQGEGTSRATISRIRDALAHARSFSGEILNYRKDGTAFWNELTILPRRDDAGYLTSFIGIIRDITLQITAEPRTVVLNEHVQFVLDHIQSGIVLHRATTEVIYANKAATALLGVQDGIVTGARDTDPRWSFCRADGSPMPIDEYPVSIAIRERRALKNYIVGTRKDDLREQKWLLCNAYPVTDDDGALSAVIVSFTDITDLRKAEQELQKSEERLRLVVQGTKDALWDWNLVTNELYHAPRWWEMVGLTEGELPLTPALWESLMHPDDRARSPERLEQMLQDGTETYELEFRLRHKDGRYVPILSRGLISRSEAGTAIRISGANMDLTERKRNEAQLYDLAFHDAVTGLANRRLLIERLEVSLRRCVADAAYAAVLHIDLDNFKLRNDTLGFEKCDAFLRQIAGRLNHPDCGAETVARLGGDEFVMVLQNLGRSEEQAAILADHFARKILRVIAEPCIIDSARHFITASVGVTLAGPEGQTTEIVLKQAELAMYNAKAAGRNALRFFDPAMQHAIEGRMSLETDFREALEKNWIEPFYQVKTEDGAGVFGAEVLVRWRHPEKGLLGPDVFIPLCEETGLIATLGAYVLAAACRQLALWAVTPGFESLTLAVNVSVRELQEAEFESSVLDTLEATGADPKKLIFEITETVLAENMADLTSKIERLRGHGIKFALDDFGTGYSSLSLLLRIPLDELKIDRSFVAGIPDSANACNLAGIIIELARQLGLSLLAEGVETEAQLGFLRSRGCRKFQGFLFARALPLAQFEALVRGKALAPTA